MGEIKTPSLCKTLFGFGFLLSAHIRRTLKSMPAFYLLFTCSVIQNFKLINHVCKTITAAALLLLHYFGDSTNHKRRSLTCHPC